MLGMGIGIYTQLNCIESLCNVKQYNLVIAELLRKPPTPPSEGGGEDMLVQLDRSSPRVILAIHLGIFLPTLVACRDGISLLQV